MSDIGKLGNVRPSQHKAAIEVSSMTAGFALTQALETRGDTREAWEGKAEVELQVLTDLLKQCTPTMLSQDQLIDLAGLGARGMTRTLGQNVGPTGAGLLSAALDLASAQVTAAVMTDRSPAVRDALAVLSQLGDVTVNVATDRTYYVDVGDTRRFISEVSSGGISGYHPSPAEALTETARALTQPGTGVAFTDPADGQRKRVAWDGERFVPAQWDEKKNGWFPQPVTRA